jgi:Trp operon repressor
MAKSVARILASLEGASDLKQFLEVFFTDNERQMLAERLTIFSELRKGGTQREIAAKVGCSVVTVTRGAKAYRKYAKQIDRWLDLA